MRASEPAPNLELVLKEALPEPEQPLPPTETAKPQMLEPEPVIPPVTRSACVMLGLRIYTVGAAVPIFAAAIMPFMRGQITAPGYWNMLGLALYAALPPMALLGAIMGFEAYRVVCRSRAPIELSRWVWAALMLTTIPFAATLWLTIPLYLHSQLRRDVLNPSGQPGMNVSLLQFLYFLIWPVVILTGMAGASDALVSNNGRSVAAPLVISTWGMLWVCDYLLLVTLAAWRSVRILEKPPSHTVQYSLGTLMAAIFGIGAWVSGLVMIYRA